MKPRKKLPRARQPKRMTVEAMRSMVPDPRTVAVLEGVFDAVQEEVPKNLKEVAPLVRAAAAMLFSIADKPFAVDTGDGVSTIVRPIDAKAVAIRAFSDLTTREFAKAAFKKKLAKP